MQTLDTGICVRKSENWAVRRTFASPLAGRALPDEWQKRRSLTCTCQTVESIIFT